ncbi:MAG: replication initiator protein [Microvirus sp.]|nr:MAG: replication initiator protein [Microvirus sp.]
MACYHPWTAFRTSAGDVVFVERGDVVEALTLACGQCWGCRLERSRQWAVRCMHEASLYEDNVFVTLTYDDDHLPPGASLHYPDFQRFMKRLRRRFSSARPRFYMCGEYGETFGRPHFHVCLFNFRFPDQVYFSKSPSGHRLFRSAVLEALWPFGHSYIGAVTFESAAYVARYVMKKITGDRAAAHYRVVDTSTGEVFDRAPEFNHMSLKPGIGRPWLDRYFPDIRADGKVVVNGRKARAPRYYEKFFESVDPDSAEALAYGRYLESLQYVGERSSERLAVREQVAIAAGSHFVRSIA